MIIIFDNEVEIDLLDCVSRYLETIKRFINIDYVYLYNLDFNDKVSIDSVTIIKG